jgi:O-acetyl-ADP-ribose deacetylase (regulator of RNase III)
VNAAHTDMIIVGGVALDILNEAGPEVEEEAMPTRDRADPLSGNPVDPQG